MDRLRILSIILLYIFLTVILQGNYLLSLVIVLVLLWKHYHDLKVAREKFIDLRGYKLKTLPIESSCRGCYGQCYILNI